MATRQGMQSGFTEGREGMVAHGFRAAEKFYLRTSAKRNRDAGAKLEAFWKNEQAAFPTVKVTKKVLSAAQRSLKSKPEAIQNWVTQKPAVKAAFEDTKSSILELDLNIAVVLMMWASGETENDRFSAYDQCEFSIDGVTWIDVKAPVDAAKRPPPVRTKTSLKVSKPSLPLWLNSSPNVVLEGVPGTGKTHAISAINVALDEDGKPVPGTGISELRSATGRQLTKALGTPSVPVEVRFMTMHPSTSYEDFVEGLRPVGSWKNATSSQKVTDGKTTAALSDAWFFKASTKATNGNGVSKASFGLKNGFFVDACVHAVENPRTAVVVVLDELNRCNIPKVLGDLMTVIEESKRAHWNGAAWVVDSPTKAVTLPYSDRKLFVPDNLFVVGTMNTTDRSVAPMDAALRRRFAFHRLWPQGFGPDADATAGGLAKRLGNASEMKASLELWKTINTQLLAKYGADAMLGHSYLDDLSRALSQKDANATEVVAYHWSYRILPQLMDVIASNGLTRSLVTNPQRFFGDENTQDIKKPGTYPVLEGKLLVDIAGEASLQSAAIRWPADS